MTLPWSVRGLLRGIKAISSASKTTEEPRILLGYVLCNRDAIIVRYRRQCDDLAWHAVGQSAQSHLTERRPKDFELTILVTGGAGFIGANFILDWIEFVGEPVVNLDALSYAGNLESLSSLAGDARHMFVRGDMGDRQLVDKLLADTQPAGNCPFCGGKSRRPEHSRAGSVHPDEHCRYFHPGGGRPRLLVGT